MQATDRHAKERLILALDVPDAASALAWVARLGSGVGLVKIGLELFVAAGPELVRRVRGLGVGVFLDLKLHDIPNTVAGGIRAVVELAPTYITIHSSGGHEMLKAAVGEAANMAAKLGVPRPKLLGVTVLTSLDRSDLEATGIDSDPSD
ncbi:MAG: orotidine 5'-phosphate decarboxylase / HUMPS family protein, partial [Terriglobales bacterium]